MAQTLNNKPIIVNGSGLFLGGETLHLSTIPDLAFRSADATDANINFQPFGTGFLGEIRGFPPGHQMVTKVTGTLSGKPIVIMCVAERIANLPDGPIYQVHCQMSEL